MAAMSEFNLLILYQVYDDRIFDSDIHSHAIFLCENRNGEKVGYGMWIVVHLKAGNKIQQPALGVF